MQQVLDILIDYQIYILAVLAVLIIFLFILIVILFSSLKRVEKRYRKLMRGTNNKSLEELINSQMDGVDEARAIAEEAQKISKDLKLQLSKCIQKYAIHRYRAFDDMGSDLSYSIALLDENHDGVIITGIYGRYETTSYAKPVDKGISRYDLSSEEELVLKEAINK